MTTTRRTTSQILGHCRCGHAESRHTDRTGPCQGYPDGRPCGCTGYAQTTR